MLTQKAASVHHVRTQYTTAPALLTPHSGYTELDRRDTNQAWPGRPLYLKSGWAGKFAGHCSTVALPGLGCDSSGSHAYRSQAFLHQRHLYSSYLLVPMCAFLHTYQAPIKSYFQVCLHTHRDTESGKTNTRLLTTASWEARLRGFLDLLSVHQHLLSPRKTYYLSLSKQTAFFKE